MTAGVACLVSCISTDDSLGSGLVPIERTYKFYTVEVPISKIDMRMADSLSAYSTRRLVVGSVNDPDYGLSTRSSAITLVPIFRDSMVIGENPQFKKFRFAIGKDTTASNNEDQRRIIQNINVYELAKAINPATDYNCNKPLAHSGRRVSTGNVVYDGGDSLTFNFSREFGEKFLSLSQSDFEDFETYTEKFPGIYIDTDTPSADGGRFNLFSHQLGYDTDYYYFTGNFAKLDYSAEFDGERKDTSVYFYYGAMDFHNIDSLLTNSSSGEYPLYALNLTSQDTRDREGLAGDKIYVEGGGGLKAVIKASLLRELALDAIASKGADPEKAIVNKASLIMPFEFPDNYLDMNYWPQLLSPTVKITSEDEDGNAIASFVGLSDTSSSSEDPGDVDRSNLDYSPDISYHVQELLKLDLEDTSSTYTQNYLKGAYDVWLLIMSKEVVTTTTAGNQDLSDMYNYLAYQSYYNSMYGGGYGNYGSYYSNYYSYAMLAAYASSSSTTSSTETLLDKDRFYKALLNGPESGDGRVPTLRITFAIPNE